MCVSRPVRSIDIDRLPFVWFSTYPLYRFNRKPMSANPQALFRPGRRNGTSCDLAADIGGKVTACAAEGESGQARTPILYLARVLFALPPVPCWPRNFDVAFLPHIAMIRF